MKENSHFDILKTPAREETQKFYKRQEILKCGLDVGGEERGSKGREMDGWVERGRRREKERRERREG